MTLHQAIADFTAADDRWHAALVRTYGRRACDARYDATRNRATDELARLYYARSRAQAVYDEAWARYHQERRQEARAA